MLLKKSLLFLIILPSSLIIACSDGGMPEPHAGTVVRDSSFTLRVKVEDNFSKTRRKNGSYIIPEKLFFIDQEFNRQTVLAKFRDGIDTTITVASDKPIWLIYDFPGYVLGRKLNFLVKPGDTALAILRNGLAHVEILGRKYDSSLYKFWPAIYQDSLYPESFKISGAVMQDKDHFTKRLTIYDNVKKQLIESWQKSTVKDSSLYSMTGKILLFELGYDALGLPLSPISEKVIQEVKDIIVKDGVSPNTPILQQFLIGYLEKRILKVVKTTDKGSKKDYKAGFDSVINIFNGEAREFLLTYCINEIYQQEKNDIFLPYYKKYDNIMGNSVMRNSFDQMMQQAGIAKEGAGPDKVQSLAKSALGLDSLLESFKGKVVYVDFWASWCMPCRAAMPASEKLRNEYNKKGIVFLYLSTDGQFDKWIAASKEEELINYPNSYLLPNAEQSKIHKELQLEFLPRYVIIDKSGKIANRDAPGPGSKELPGLLNKLIAE